MYRSSLKLTSSALIFLFVGSCSVTETELKEGWWKYGEGYHVADVLDFRTEYTLHGDTLLQGRQPAGMIISIVKLPVGDNRMEITSLDRKQTGYYYQKK